MTTIAKKKISLGKIETVSIDSVRPYWRNPRRVTEEAVNLLAKSISDYGYSQPIVVDTEYVIVVGHTRYAAMRRLNVTEVPVMVATTLTPEQIKQYRLIDNKSSELTSWDFSSLMDELGELDSSISTAFFPEVSGHDVEGFTDDQLLEREWDKVDTKVGFVCPSCFHSWEIEVTRNAILAGVIKAGEDS